MHIRDMMKVLHRHGPHVQEAQPRNGLLPVAIHVELETPVSKPRHLIDSVKAIKATPWYRALRKRGFRFVPIGHHEGMVLVVVGTAASLGAAYLAYRRLKDRDAPKNEHEPQETT